MRQTLPLPLASARVVVPGFSLFLSLSLCVLYPSAKAVKSRKVIYELYNTAGGRGGGDDDDGEFRFDAHPQTENVCVHSAQHTAHSRRCRRRRRRRVLPLPHRSLLSSRECFCRVCVMAEMRNFSSPPPIPPRTFLFLFYCSVYYFIIFDLLCVCVCVCVLRHYV
jgi:hypothetical protein